MLFFLYEKPVPAENKAPQSKENVVNIYSSRKEEMVKDLFASFAERTGIKVNYITDDATKLISRMKSEGVNTSADVFLAADVINLALAEAEGLLQCISSTVLENALPPELRDCYWFGLTRRMAVIVYSKERVDPSEIRNYEDLADSKWKDRLLLRSSNSPYNRSLIASVILANGEEKAEAWIKGIVRNMARPPYGGDTDQIKGVASGEGDLTVVNSYYLARILSSDKETHKKVAQRVGVIFPNQENRGTFVNISGAGVAKNAKHKENAKKFLEYMVTEEAQKLYVSRNYEYPVVASVEIPEILKNWGDYKVDSSSLSKIFPYMSAAVYMADQNGWK
ncbi:Fe(3+) ABC transporter substrate-binding protein [Neorickettsia sennetsu]|uniref:Iron-binding protein n=1 Tax=Ehrlichia sennetsu (strain ATCC VR-367 / Miyayama) TaxID=222891 RepID=Q2GF05_EHRS3|nr:iron-binding protein [Neorickettsia sennetsu str. Miyayama]